MKHKKAKEAAYLAGAIDLAPEFGVGWRKSLIPRLRALGIEGYDPTVVNKRIFRVRSVQKAEKILRELWEKDREKWLRVVIQMEKANIKSLLGSNFVITYWNPAQSTYGVPIENSLAALQGIPIYCVHYTPVEDLPKLLRRDVIQSLGEFFPNFDELLNFLKSRRKIIEQNSKNSHSKNSKKTLNHRKNSAKL